jgi:hypothetical protein
MVFASETGRKNTAATRYQGWMPERSIDARPGQGAGVDAPLFAHGLGKPANVTAFGAVAPRFTTDGAGASFLRSSHGPHVHVPALLAR